MFDLHGHTALVTGATQGVGSVIAQSLAAAGCEVLLHGLTDSGAARETLGACRNHGVRCELVCADLTEPTEAVVGQLLEATLDFSRRPTLLVNNAGSYFDVPFLELSYATYRKTMRLNVDAYFFLTQQFARFWVQESIAGRVLMDWVDQRFARRTDPLVLRRIKGRGRPDGPHVMRRVGSAWNSWSTASRPDCSTRR